MRLPPVLLVLAGLAVGPAASAVDPAEWSYQIVSGRGKARLVQKCRGPGACEATAFDRRQRVLWRVPRALAPLGGTAIDDDGVHVVHVTELLPEASRDAEILAFWRRGELSRRWTLGELVPAPEQLPARPDGSRLWARDYRLAGGVLEVTLVNGERAAFAVDRGERIR